MAHGENLHVLIFEEDADTAESLANLLGETGHPLQLDHISEAGELETAFKAFVPDILVCGARQTSPAFANMQALLAARSPEFPVITVTDILPEGNMAEANPAAPAQLFAYDRPDEIRRAFTREVEVLGLRRKLDRLECRLHAAEQRCHAFIEQSSDAVACLHDGMHVYANRAYMDLFAISTREDIEGTPILDIIDSSEHEHFRNFLCNYGQHQGTAETLHVNCLNAGGETFESNMEFSPAIMDGEACIQVIVRPRHSNAELEKRLDALSRNDILTGLYNRQYFMRVLGDSINSQQQEAGACALIYILLDNFKSIRENVGVAASDFLLRDIAMLVEKLADRRDCAARFGEYAFAVLHYDSSKEKIQALGERLLHEIAGHVSGIDGYSLNTTASIGICAVTAHSNNAQDILSRADLACEVARSAGGNQIHTHSIAVDEQMSGEDNHNCHDIIRNTIDENRFYLVYQPIISLKGNSGERYEVLLRVVDEAGHVILPGQFLNIAEQTGLSGEIDRWIINRAFKQLAKMRADGREISFFIKLSGTSLTDSRLPDWINLRLQHYRLVSDGIIFEIPELIAASDLKNAIIFFRSMERIHCKVALEHYGCSNQPQLLNHLPADFLKIDGSLINNLAAKEENQSQVKSVVSLARKHGKKCIAEHVEEAADLALLWQYGVDFIQGNFVQEPSRQLSYDFEGEIA
ncbi:MAG: EAL domain-containing protein [Gammaproteobacteria bacterium]